MDDERRPSDPSPEQQDPESSAAADAPRPSEDEGGEQEPRTEDLDREPDYNPDEHGIGRLKGG